MPPHRGGARLRGVWPVGTVRTHRLGDALSGPERPGPRGGSGEDRIAAAHADAVARGATTYRDPATGFRVFTRSWLLARGICCDQGCRHCPYGSTTKS
ncbi:MAG: DUF5522 domain-containing protein [Acidimicrobiales bacterium]